MDGAAGGSHWTRLRLVSPPPQPTCSGCSLGLAGLIRRQGLVSLVFFG